MVDEALSMGKYDYFTISFTDLIVAGHTKLVKPTQLWFKIWPLVYTGQVSWFTTSWVVNQLRTERGPPCTYNHMVDNLVKIGHLSQQITNSPNI